VVTRLVEPHADAVGARLQMLAREYERIRAILPDRRYAFLREIVHDLAERGIVQTCRPVVFVLLEYSIGLGRGVPRDAHAGTALTSEISFDARFPGDFRPLRHFRFYIGAEFVRGAAADVGTQ
jgi:hypothetical protein